MGYIEILAKIISDRERAKLNQMSRDDVKRMMRKPGSSFSPSPKKTVEKKFDYERQDNIIKLPNLKHEPQSPLKSKPETKGTKTPSKSKPKSNDAKMRDLATESGLIFMGADLLRSAAQDDDPILIYAYVMPEWEYKELEKEIKSKVIRGDGYKVYASMDMKGYKYWCKQAENFENPNYVNIIARIDLKKIDRIDPEKLQSDVDDLYFDFSQYENIEEWRETSEE